MSDNRTFQNIADEIFRQRVDLENDMSSRESAKDGVSELLERIVALDNRIRKTSNVPGHSSPAPKNTARESR